GNVDDLVAVLVQAGPEGVGRVNVDADLRRGLLARGDFPGIRAGCWPGDDLPRDRPSGANSPSGSRPPSRPRLARNSTASVAAFKRPAITPVHHGDDRPPGRFRPGAAPRRPSDRRIPGNPAIPGSGNRYTLAGSRPRS